MKCGEAQAGTPAQRFSRCCAMNRASLCISLNPAMIRKAAEVHGRTKAV